MTTIAPEAPTIDMGAIEQFLSEQSGPGGRPLEVVATLPFTLQGLSDEEAAKMADDSVGRVIADDWENQLAAVDIDAVMLQRDTDNFQEAHQVIKAADALLVLTGQVDQVPTEHLSVRPSMLEHMKSAIVTGAPLIFQRDPGLDQGRWARPARYYQRLAEAPILADTNQINQVKERLFGS